MPIRAFNRCLLFTEIQVSRNDEVPNCRPVRGSIVNQILTTEAYSSTADSGRSPMARLLITLYDSRETRVDPVTLVALFQQSRFSGIADYQPADMGFQEIGSQPF